MSRKSGPRFFKFFPGLIGFESYLPEAKGEKLELYDVLVYGCLYAYSGDKKDGESFASYKRIARELAISRSTVYRSIDKLSRFGIIYMPEKNLPGRTIHFKCVQPEALHTEDKSTILLYHQEPRAQQAEYWEEKHPKQVKGAGTLKEHKIIKYRVRKSI